MKRILLPLLVIGILLLNACTAPTTTIPIETPSAPVVEPVIPAHFTTYTDEIGFFSISYPPSWELGISELEVLTQDIKDYLEDYETAGSLAGGKPVFLAGIPYETGFNPNVSIVVTLPGEGKWELEDFVELVVSEGYMKDAEEYNEFSRTETVVDGKKAIILDFEAKYPLLMAELRVLTVFVRDKNLVWGVSCGVLSPKDFSDYETDLHAIVRSLRILK